jgi:hypothetical protein
MLVGVLVGAGFVLGLVVGRWWALTAAAVVGVVAALFEEIEVEGWFLGLVYAVLAAIGISIGILIRRFAGRPSGPPS